MNCVFPTTVHISSGGGEGYTLGRQRIWQHVLVFLRTLSMNIFALGRYFDEVLKHFGTVALVSHTCKIHTLFFLIVYNGNGYLRI